MRSSKPRIKELPKIRSADRFEKSAVCHFDDEVFHTLVVRDGVPNDAFIYRADDVNGTLILRGVQQTDDYI